MIHTILTTAIGSITSLIIGYLIKSLSNYKKRDDVQSKALRNILKGNLVNQFYVYEEIGSVPRYVKEAWYDMFESYTELNGNSYVKHSIEPEFAKLEIVDNEWYNINYLKIDDVDFYIVMNSLVNDYGKVIDKEDTNTYAKMARSFILDEDAKKNKVWIYFTKIVK